MILYVLRQNTNSNSKAYGKWFAYPVIEETVTLDGLAEHMANHNTPFSKGAIKGMLTDMVGCIKELLLEGKNVKIADLAIFSLGIKNNGGAESVEEFNVSKNIKGVKLRSRATGVLIAKSLNLVANLKKASATTKPAKPDGEGDGPDTLELIRSHQVDLVINIPKNFTHVELSNGYRIRRAAIDFNVPLITNSRLATAYIRAFCRLSPKELPVKAWDEYQTLAVS